MARQASTTIKRAGVSLYVSVVEKNGRNEYQVKRGNKIISRHAREADADTALRSLMSGAA